MVLLNVLKLWEKWVSTIDKWCTYNPSKALMLDFVVSLATIGATIINVCIAMKAMGKI